jgi:hypothetical protein
LCIAFAASSLRVAAKVEVYGFELKTMAEYLAALAASAVFVVVQRIFAWAAAGREREAARRQWQAELRSRGA